MGIPEGEEREMGLAGLIQTIDKINLLDMDPNSGEVDWLFPGGRGGHLQGRPLGSHTWEEKKEEEREGNFFYFTTFMAPNM